MKLPKKSLFSKGKTRPCFHEHVSDFTHNSDQST